MTPAEAIDLLSIAARSSTWDARPADAAALLEVVRGVQLAEAQWVDDVDRLTEERDRLTRDLTTAQGLLSRTMGPDVDSLASTALMLGRVERERNWALAEVERLKVSEQALAGHRRAIDSLDAEVERLRDGMEVAWGIIANAGGGDWDSQGEKWKQAATRWRDEHWHPALSRIGPVAHADSPTVMEGGTPRGPELDAAARCADHECPGACLCCVAPAVREQPAPRPGGEAVWPSLLASGLVPESLRADCEARHRLGVERYGRALETGNGRDALADAYQEALDLAVYLWQAHLEGGRDGSCFRPLAKDVIAVAAYIKGAMR